MKKHAVCIFVIGALLAGCGGRRSIEHGTDISMIDSNQTITSENAEDILRTYIVDFTIPNPLFGAGGGGQQSRLTDPTHESEIDCRAVLLDKYSTEADILFNCGVDSLTGDECATYRSDYEKQYIQDDRFRIMIAMESGFSDKSMEPDHWAMYLITNDGVMVEPTEQIATPVTTADDSVYSDYYRRQFERRMLKRKITLYFPTKTFFGEEPLNPANHELVLIMSREQRIVARVKWKLSSQK